MNLIDQLQSAPSQAYKFPKDAFNILYENGYLKLPRFRNDFQGNIADYETAIILQDLINIGYADLAVGRIYEGHINALLIIDEFGTLQQKEKYFQEAAEGKVFGIWNSERPFEAVKFNPDSDANELIGAKTFCSGGLEISRPIITAHTDEGKQMVILEMEQYPQLEEDKSMWKVVGMESTVSHRIDFSGIPIPKTQFIGSLNDYDREPMISTGAIRFAAVQFGAAKAIADIAIQHLKKTNRAEHPMQNHRIAQLGILINQGKLWFDGYNQINKSQDNKHMNFVNMVRTDILRICEEVLSISEKAIGVQGFLKPHPFESKYRDLKVYLKQPNPDLAIEKVGKYYSKHDFSQG